MQHISTTYRHWKRHFYVWCMLRRGNYFPEYSQTVAIALFNSNWKVVPWSTTGYDICLIAIRYQKETTFFFSVACRPGWSLGSSDADSLSLCLQMLQSLLEVCSQFTFFFHNLSIFVWTPTFKSVVWPKAHRRIIAWQVVSAFHIGQGGASMSYMGCGVTKSATLCLRHLAYEMASKLQSKVRVFWNLIWKKM